MSELARLYGMEGLYEHAAQLLNSPLPEHCDVSPNIAAYYLHVISAQLGESPSVHGRFDFGIIRVLSPFCLYFYVDEDSMPSVVPITAPTLSTGYVTNIFDGSALEHPNGLPVLRGNRNWHEGLYLELSSSPQHQDIEAGSFTAVPLPESVLYFPENNPN